jgi:hypothetical protein
MNAQADQPFAVLVRLASQQFLGCRNAGVDWKRRLNEEDAALKLHYGQLALDIDRACTCVAG